MSKEEILEFKGKVTDLLPNAMFKVELENGHEVSHVLCVCNIEVVALYF